MNIPDLTGDALTVRLSLTVSKFFSVTRVNWTSACGGVLSDCGSVDVCPLGKPVRSLMRVVGAHVYGQR